MFRYDLKEGNDITIEAVSVIGFGEHSMNNRWKVNIYKDNGTLPLNFLYAPVEEDIQESVSIGLMPFVYSFQSFNEVYSYHRGHY